MMSRSDREVVLLLLQIGHFIALDLGAVILEGFFIFGGALVAAVGRQMRLLLAPQVEIHGLDVVILAGLGERAGCQPTSMKATAAHLIGSSLS